MEQEVTISRLPDSVLEEFEDYIDAHLDEPDQRMMSIFKMLLLGYGETWDKLERINGGIACNKENSTECASCGTTSQRKD